MAGIWDKGLRRADGSFTFLSIDPRTLGLFRVALAILLLADLQQRLCCVDLWYTNSGLLPNHTGLWRPGRPWVFSFFWGCSNAAEATALMLAIGAVYVSLLVGYRTRLCQVLSLVAVLSLQVRVDMLSNGGDFVLCILAWWSVFLPLGKRFSLDVLLKDLRQHPEHDLEPLRSANQRPRDTAPVVSLAVVAASLQLAAIYFFNTVHKSGSTWVEGSAVHYLWHQTRVITPGGLWARQLPPAASIAFSYGTLVMEGAITVAILSPVARVWCRRAAVLLIFGLHAAILLTTNLGTFPFVMMVFSLLLVQPEDWECLGRWARGRASLKRRVFFDADCGICFLAVRVLARLDGWQRLTFYPTQDSAQLPQGASPELVTETLLVTDADGSRWWTHWAALTQAVRVLPLGAFLAPWMRLPGIQQLGDTLYKKLAANRAHVSSFLGLGVCGLSPAAVTSHSDAATPDSDAKRWFAGILTQLREVTVVGVMIVAGLQLLTENPAIPRALRPGSSTWHNAAIAYSRLQQGWSMFAPEAPMSEVYVIVDAITQDGRHVDPIAEASGVERTATDRRIPLQPGLTKAWVTYMHRIEGDTRHHRPLREWLERYPKRTGRAEDQLTHYDVLVLRQDSPPLGEHDMRNFREARLLTGP